MVGMMENAFINVKNRSHSVTAEVEVPAGGARGVVLAQAGRFAGWSLYFREGRPEYAYNWIGREVTTVASAETVPPGRATVRLDFEYDGGGLGKGGRATLSVDGKKVAEGRIERTMPLLFSGDEGADVGMDEETPVTSAYPERDNRFNGRIHGVTIDLR
jgi:arylsulfatase